MSDTGTFDAAINHLNNRLNSRGEGSEREELRQAIRVLEAVGNVDKKECMALIDDLCNWCAIKEQPNEPCLNCRLLKTQIRALLEFLPGPREKK